jgi:hypothetical protein
MPRKSRADILADRMIDELELMAFDASKPDYIRTKAMGTLASLMQRRDRRQAERAEAAAARKAERDQANFVYPNVLPDNGRLVAKPSGLVAPFVIPAGVNRP